MPSSAFDLVIDHLAPEETARTRASGPSEGNNSIKQKQIRPKHSR